MSSVVNPEERRIVAIHRNTQGSERHRTDDRRLLEEVSRRLTERGFAVTEMEERDATSSLPQFLPAVVLSMAQSPSAVEFLEAVDPGDSLVLNSISSVRNTYRTRFVELCSEHQVPLAASVVLRLSDGAFDVDRTELLRLVEDRARSLSRPLWVKRGDIHAAHPEDVTLAESASDIVDRCIGFCERHVNDVVLQEHLSGRTLKFYGVAGEPFFHVQDFETGDRCDDAPPLLEEIARRTADVLGLTVFGGDAIEVAPGNVRLIDFNAWPSFGTVRESAVPFIVDAIVKRIRAVNSGAA